MLKFVLTLALAFMLMPVMAFAQEVIVPETVVQFQWGDLIGVFLTNLASNPESGFQALLLAVLTWLATRLPKPLQWAFNLFKVDQLLERALVSAMNQTKGATAGKTLSLDVGNEVLAKALQYAINNGQAAIIEWMGGIQGVRAKLIARMDVAADAELH